MTTAQTTRQQSLLPGDPEDAVALAETRTRAVEAVHLATALYTTSSVVDALLDRLDWPHAGGRLLDPSAGDGSFLLRALARLDLSDASQLERVRGWEIYPEACHEARRHVAALLQGAGWEKPEARTHADRIVLNLDFLTDGPDHGEFDVIAGNPPYLRQQRLPDYFKLLYTDLLPKYARADLLHAFLDSCVRLLADGGRIGFVCSDRFLFNERAAELRARLGMKVGISHLARLDPSTSFYRPKLRAKGTPPRIHPVEVVLRPSVVASMPLTATAISPDEFGLEPHQGLTLGQVARVSIAPWLGPAGIFVVAGDVAEKLRGAGADLVPAVDTDDVDPHSDELNKPTRYAIRTTRDVEPAGAVAEHLLRERARMPKRGRGRAYWMPPETITLPLDQPRLLIPRIARRLRAIPLPAGVLPINHNLSVVAAKDSGTTLDELRELITGDDSQAWLRRHAPRLESGFYSITTTLLRRLPV